MRSIQIGVTFKSLGKFTYPFLIFLISSPRFLPVKGGTPAKSSNRITPTDQRSALSVYFSPFYISGAMYIGVPAIVSWSSPSYSHYNI